MTVKLTQISKMCQGSSRLLVRSSIPAMATRVRRVKPLSRIQKPCFALLVLAEEHESMSEWKVYFIGRK
jgi:hypothetical protein